MNSINTLRSMLIDSSLRLSRLSVNSYKYCYYQYLCSVADYKINPDNISEDKHTDSRINSNSSFINSDKTGTFKVSSGKSSKFNRNSQTRSTKHENKKIIKIKKITNNNEGDIFGNLSDRKPIWYPDINEESKEDNDLSDDSVIIKNLSKKFRCPNEYLKEMIKLVEKKKIKEALDLFVDMRRHFVSPIHPQYTYMISACGKVGYTEMAFKLLRQMTDRSFIPTPATLTGLFNSCAESPFPEYGLKKAHLLKEKIDMKNWNVNQITYRAMIKAFGRCGDMITAFKIVDEMAKADIKINAATFNFLLSSCISNKEAGFTYAVEVWRMMKAKKCLPDLFTFNLLLRATRDCDIGPEEISCLLLQHWSSYTKRPYGFVTKESLSKKPILKLSSATNDNTAESLDEKNKNQTLKIQNEKLDDSSSTENTSAYEIKKTSDSSVTPNSQTLVASVLSNRPIHGPEILEILDIKTRSDRLSLLGGLNGFLQLMFQSKMKPNIKTFTLLLECIPDNIQEEENLLTLLDRHQIKPDIDFFNVLIKRRIFRRDDPAAHNVLILINKYELAPDIMTFGALALGCRNLQHASTFISEMKKMGSYPNIEIVGCMIKRACMILDFSYMKYVLKLMEDQHIKPNERVLLVLEKCLSNVRENVILMEHGKEVDTFYQKEGLQTDFKEFISFYEDWLKRMKYQAEEHPWLQYKTDIIDRTKEETI